MLSPVNVAGTHHAHNVAMLLVQEWELFMLARRLSQRTITERIRVIKSFASSIGIEPSQASALDVARWLAQQSSLGQSSLATYSQYLKAWFKWLQVHEHRTDDPMVKVGTVRYPDRAPRPVSDRDLARLLETVNRKRTRLMVLLYCLAGLRAFEIAKLRGEDIVDGVFVRVLGKGNKERLVPLHPILQAIAPTMPERGWWFPRDSRWPGMHISGKSVSQTISLTMRRAGVRATPHQLRHWQGTTLLDEGVDIRVVQEIMRHASISTTAQYTQVPTHKTSEAVSRLNPFRGAETKLTVALAG
ncbi:tyrosine-type recombinase/integrase [Segniliparus rotundus]|uniref:tyrosine-type recombinase/integrase n=1 Tax=Segniliparus rotundus TaxID=286802 RepID=UPI001FE037FF|nr:tyrosine-type recombinase/integrase [Segniliparus rotundus]